MSLPPIRVGPSGRYFQTFEGEPFLFLGANDALAWPGLEPLRGKRDLPAVERYLRSFSDNGATILRVMLEYVHDNEFFFESPVGHFRPEIVGMWDDLFDLCDKVGLRVLLTPWDTFWMALRWQHHPYNARNGGPAASPDAFFNDEATIEATLHRFEFVIERWKGCATLAAWDLWNEIHPHYGGPAERQTPTIERQSRFIRDTEERVQAWTRPQTVSVFGPQPSDGYHDLIFKNSCLDFASTHIYSKGAIDHPHNTVTAAGVMAKWTRYALEHASPDKPFLDSEHGPIHLFNDRKRMLPLAFDDEYERHMMWAHLCSGGAGSGLRWPARHPHTVTEGMKTAIKGLAEFARFTDWNTFHPTDWRAKIRLNGISRRQVHVFAVGDGQQTVGVLMRRPPSKHRGRLPLMSPLRGTEICLSNLQSESCAVTLFDPLKGVLIDQGTYKTHKGKVSLPLQEWTSEIAFALKSTS